MELIKNAAKSSLVHIKVLLKWLVVAVVVGALGGVIGSLFHMSVDFVTEFRGEYPKVIFLLPVAGVIIAAMYGLFRAKGKLDTNRVLEAVRGEKDVPIVMLPLIFISTVITHFVGGSAGREGAALQLGGSIGYNIGKILRFDKKDMRLVVMAGMSSVFSALFGTPLTAAVFSLEVSEVGNIRYAGLLPCIIASVVAYKISLIFGVTPVRFAGIAATAGSITMLKVAVLSVLCALVSILFCTAIKKCEHYADKLISSKYLRSALGGVLLIVLTLAVGSYDYNGAGMDVIKRAMSGEAKAEAFLLKIIFTAVTIAAGFKGGEIVPAFFIGSSFGCAVAPLIGMDSGFGAAIGFVTMFCGVVNCPIASVFLAAEVFGTDGLLSFALACAVCSLMSGNFSLYNSQKIIFSKLYGAEEK